VLVTGHDGYIGRVLVPILAGGGHDVVGLDACWSADRGLGAPGGPPEMRLDVRDLRLVDLAGFDAVVHLAAISGDAPGALHSDLIFAVNLFGTLRLAALAKAAGVERFLFASSCAVYGAGHASTPMAETAPLCPATAYARSKASAERDLASLADYGFSPTFLRIPTAYGFSPRLRMDLLVNHLAGIALLTGDVLIVGDGSAWHPAVHVQDVAHALRRVLEARRRDVHNEAFNIGRDAANHRTLEIAESVAGALPGSRVRCAAEGPAGDGTCRVDFTKLHRAFPELAFDRDVRCGAQEVVDALRTQGPIRHAFVDSRSGRALDRRAVEGFKAALRPDDRYVG
jgi:nucleoside-diphosphate-sugar epimerase